MKNWLIYVAIMMTSWLLPHQSFAQGTDVGISTVGLVSIQPIDDAYLGGPYLSEAIGGVGPGFGAGLSVTTAGGLVIGAEYTTAFFEQEQYGRVVIGEGIVATTRLRDSLLTGFLGHAVRAGRTTTRFVGGVSARLDSPTVDGVSRDGEQSNKSNPFPVVLTGGIDVLRQVSPRVSLLFGGRYSFNQRHEVQQYLGIGPHLIRLTAGLHITLN